VKTCTRSRQSIKGGDKEEPCNFNWPTAELRLLTDRRNTWWNVAKTRSSTELSEEWTKEMLK